ncbi:carboxymuconolactone decarboxylase family protein [Streptomyces bambusae]|uniref:carboxymuconolactone decarboxylase family protein n=1 Tax=Streptomyces bambusae TaxID=1550616 RepID=UPI001CFCCBAE|nr:carboxymuconolactone decarboxylase family protein [Streptomyces bambusae]MCB5165650.1 carboxymuconolactone decarboxylase family protein [Streptomyces bambusae]
MRPIVRAVLRGSLGQIRYVRAVRPGEAEGTVARVYDQAQREFGVLAPPLALHSPAPGPLTAGWLLLRETLLVEGRASRAEKELVATAVSEANRCPYCVEVHRAAMEVLPSAGSAARGLADWAAAAGRRTGEAAPAVPFGANAAPEICGTALTFHYLNRMVTVFLEDSPMPAQSPAAIRGPVMRTVARTMRPERGPLAPGTSLGLLPEAPLPDALAWAAGNPSVAGAVARAVAAVEAAGAWIPDGVRECVQGRLAEWDGTAPGPSRAWLAEASEGVAAADRPAAAVALLTAFAPYQVTAADVAQLRARSAGDRELIELTSWASLSAAVHLAGRFPVPDTICGD